MDDIISDLYKDVHGFRPRGSFVNVWAKSSEEEKQIIFDELCSQLEEVMAEESRQKDLAVQEFIQILANTIIYGAGDRKTALRWMTQSEKFYNEQDVEHWVWNQGVLFTDYGKALVKELMEIVEFEEG